MNTEQLDNLQQRTEGQQALDDLHGNRDQEATSPFAPRPPMMLLDYISDYHNGSITTFATCYNISRQTVYNWLDGKAMWWMGDVWVCKNVAHC